MPDPNPRRVFLSAIIPALVLPALLLGCENNSQKEGERIPFDPDKAKSQEDSMKRAAEASMPPRKKK